MYWVYNHFKHVQVAHGECHVSGFSAEVYRVKSGKRDALSLAGQFFFKSPPELTKN